MINESLQKLYSRHWDSFQKACKSITVRNSLSNPLLIRVREEETYRKADIKLMFIGQETNTWYKGSSLRMEELLFNYENFYKNPKKKGPFWRAINSFMADLQKKYPQKSIDYTWNNCIKVGRKHSKGKPSSDVVDIEQKHFNVLKNEINILKPHVIVFLSGPRYDKFIRAKLNDAYFKEVDGFKTRQISLLEIPGVKYAFRTYHPNYLQRSKKGHYLSAILNEIQL